MSAAATGLTAAIRRSRWPALAVALAVILLDQWTKELAVAALASPTHPMVVAADGQASVAALLATRGVDEATTAAAVGRRMVWRYGTHAALAPGLRTDERQVPRQVILVAATGFPAPRRIRFLAEDRQQTISEVLVKQARATPAAIAATLAAGVLAAETPALDPSERPDAGEHIALLDRSIDLIPGFMKLVYAENPGAAWGFMRDAGDTMRLVFFSVVAIVAAFAMIWAIWTGWMGSAFGTLALGAILGGALGNLVDRLRYQVVVDFVLNYIGDARWPVYNIADVAISAGVALILIEMLLARRSQRLHTDG